MDSNEILAKQEIKYHEMTTEPIPRLVVKLAIPTIISMLINSIYNLADTFFVGRIGTQATAAIGIAFSMMAMIQAFGFFFGHGAGIYVSRKLGCKDSLSANIMGNVGLVTAIIVGIVFALISSFFISPLCVALGSTPTILPYAVSYLRITVMGVPIIMSSLVINNVLRYQGNAMYAMVGLVSGAVINIILTPIFIFGLDLGIRGAAYATVVSQFIGLVILFAMNKKCGGIEFHVKYLRPSLALLVEIARGGTPALLRQGLAGVAVAFLNNAARGHGDAAIAAVSIVGRVMMFCGMIMIGFGQGFQPVCSFNYGAKLHARVREAFYFCNRALIVFLAAMAAIFAVFAPQIIALFRKDDLDVIEIGTRALRFQCIGLPLSGFIALSNMMLQVMGHAVKSSIIAAARQGLFFIPLILILPRLFGLTGVIVTQVTADILTFIIAVPLTVGVIRGLKE